MGAKAWFGGMAAAGGGGIGERGGGQRPAQGGRGGAPSGYARERARGGGPDRGGQNRPRRGFWAVFGRFFDGFSDGKTGEVRGGLGRSKQSLLMATRGRARAGRATRAAYRFAKRRLPPAWGEAGAGCRTLNARALR